MIYAAIVLSILPPLLCFQGPSSWLLISTSVTDSGIYTQESDVYKSVSSNESHRFQGSFPVLRRVTGSTETGPAWTSPFTPLGDNSTTQSYDLTIQFTAVGHEAWVKMYSSTEVGTEIWRNGITSAYATRNRNWATPGTAFLVGPL
jgi:hypothetical protein